MLANTTPRITSASSAIHEYLHETNSEHNLRHLCRLKLEPRRMAFLRDSSHVADQAALYSNKNLATVAVAGVAAAGAIVAFVSSIAGLLRSDTGGYETEGGRCVGHSLQTQGPKALQNAGNAVWDGYARGMSGNSLADFVPGVVKVVEGFWMGGTALVQGGKASYNEYNRCADTPSVGAVPLYVRSIEFAWNNKLLMVALSCAAAGWVGFKVFQYKKEQAELAGAKLFRQLYMAIDRAAEVVRLCYRSAQNDPDPMRRVELLNACRRYATALQECLPIMVAHLQRFSHVLTPEQQTEILKPIQAIAATIIAQHGRL